MIAPRPGSPWSWPVGADYPAFLQEGLDSDCDRFDYRQISAAPDCPDRPELPLITVSDRRKLVAMFPSLRRILARAAAGATVVTALAVPANAVIKLALVKIYGVERLTNLDPEADLGRLTSYDGDLYLTMTDANYGEELWKWDGTTMSLAADVAPGAEDSSPYHLVVYGGALYFSARTPATGRELYRFDGNTASLAADIVPGPAHSEPSEPILYSGALYFRAGDPDHGHELWKWDGTTASMVADLRPGPEWSWPTKFIVYDGALYFLANNGTSGNDLWRYDGSSVSFAADFFPAGSGGNVGHARPRAVYDGFLYFSEVDSGVCGDLCRFDGMAVSTAAELAPAGTKNSLWELTVHGGDLYFGMSSDNLGLELGRYDGQTAVMAADLYPGPDDSFPINLTVFDGELFYQAITPQHGDELRYGLSLVADIRPGALSSSISWLTVHGDALYFTADDGTHGDQLWRVRRTGQLLDIYAEIGAIFDEWWLWPIEAGNPIARSAGTLGLFALATGEAPRLLARRETRLGSPGRELIYDPQLLDPKSVPETLALATVIFQDATGRMAASSVEVAALEGEPEEGVREALEREAGELLAGLTLEDLRAMEVRDFPAGETDGDGPGAPTAPYWRSLLLAAIGFTGILLLAALLRRLSGPTR